MLGAYPDRMAYRIEINVDDCMSSGKCVGDYPKTFDFDDDELATIIESGEALSDATMVKAARNCPSRAIQVFDETGTQIPT